MPAHVSQRTTAVAEAGSCNGGLHQDGGPLYREIRGGCEPRVERAGPPFSPGEPSRNGELRDRDGGEIIPGSYASGPGIDSRPAGVPLGGPGCNGGNLGFRSPPLALAPKIERLVATLPMEA